MFAQLCEQEAWCGVDPEVQGVCLLTLARLAGEGQIRDQPARLLCDAQR